MTRERPEKKKKGQETCEEKWVRGVVPKLRGWEVLLQFGDQMWGRGGEGGGGGTNSSRQRLPNASWSKSLAKTAWAEASHLRLDDTSIGVDGKLTVRSQRAPKALWTAHYVAELRVNLGRDDVCVGVCLRLLLTDGRGVMRTASTPCHVRHCYCCNEFEPSPNAALLLRSTEAHTSYAGYQTEELSKVIMPFTNTVWEKRVKIRNKTH